MSRTEVSLHILAWSIFVTYMIVGFVVWGAYGPLWYALLGIPASALMVPSIGRLMPKLFGY